MSGGSFNYAYSQVQSFSEDLVNKIDENEKPDRYGDAHRFAPEVLNELLALADEARRLSVRMRAAEWLYSGDIGEETFLKRIAEARQ